MEKHDPLLIVETTGKLMVLGGQGFWSFSPPQARRWLERAIEIGRTAEVPEEKRQERQLHLGLALGAMGSINLTLGRHEEGAAAGAKAVSILRPFGESRYLAFALGSYAFNLNYLGRLSEALEAGEEAREVAGAQSDRVALSIALAALGMSTLMSGDMEEAHEYLRAGKAVIEELGSRPCHSIGRRFFIFRIWVTNLRSQTSSNASPTSPSHSKSRKKQAGYWGRPRRSGSGQIIQCISPGRRRIMSGRWSSSAACWGAPAGMPQWMKGGR